MLLERGADIEATDRVLFSSFFLYEKQLSFSSSSPAQFRLLTPLHYAVEEGLTEIASLLLDRGADIEAKAEVLNDHKLQCRIITVA
jgi:ankyrin repeat protein